MLFPGLISLSIIVYSLLPSLFDPLLEAVLADHDGLRRAGIVFDIYLWLALSMLVSYTAMVVEKRPRALAWLAPALLFSAAMVPCCVP